MLGNLFTSLISAVGTYIWLVAFGVPYALLLALVVAVLDLIPMVGIDDCRRNRLAGCADQRAAGGIATAAFYITYRFLEDYLLNPRGNEAHGQSLTRSSIIATLVGGSLLGIVGALIAIPIAATIHLCSGSGISKAEPTLTTAQ